MEVKTIKTYNSSSEVTRVTIETSELTLTYKLNEFIEASKGMSHDLLHELHKHTSLIAKMDSAARANDRWYSLWVVTEPNNFKIFDVDNDDVPYDELFIEC